MRVSAATLVQLRKLLDDLGERQALKRLGIPRHTFARVLAGMSVRDGTVALLEQRLHAVDAGEAP